MRTAFTELVGVEHPLVAFNRSPAVVAEASKAGALGVFAASVYSPEELDVQLSWIEGQLDGRPYGVDLLVPQKAVAGDPGNLVDSLRAQIPQEHFDFIEELLRAYDIPPLPEGQEVRTLGNTDASLVPQLLEVCFAHDISLIANGLGTPPPEMLERARSSGVPVAALVGRKEHAERQLSLGVDVLVAQGTEAGGHTGEIASFVLTPEVLEVAGSTPVLTAGGVASGAQLAASLAMGAAGGWAGSVWLATFEDVANAAIKQKLLAARSSDTLRSRTRTGKPARQLRSAYHDAWDRSGAPEPLPMPLQLVLSREAFDRIDAAAEDGHEGAIELESFYVGQVVGSFHELRTTADVVREIVDEAEARIRALRGVLV